MPNNIHVPERRALSVARSGGSGRHISRATLYGWFSKSGWLR